MEKSENELDLSEFLFKKLDLELEYYQLIAELELE